MNGIPSFRGTPELKFTREEMEAIRNAERGFGWEPQHPQRDLAETIGEAIGTLIFVLLLGLLAEMFLAVVSRPPRNQIQQPRFSASSQYYRTLHASPSPAASVPMPGASADVGSTPRAGSLSAPNPVPPGVIIFRKFTDAPRHETHVVRIIRLWPDAKPVQQSAVTTPAPRPADMQPPAQAASEASQARNIAAEGGPPPFAWPRLAMPMPSQVLAAGIGTWHHFTSSPAISEVAEQARQRPFPVFRQPAPRIPAFNRYVAGAVMPRHQFVPMPPPPMPAPVPLWGVPVCRCRRVAERR